MELARSIHRQKHCRLVLLGLALVSLALRVMVPVGFMVASPSMAGQIHGGIPIVLCTAQGNVAAIMAEDGSLRVVDHEDGNNSDQTDHALCVFATNAAQTVPAATGPISTLSWQVYPTPLLSKADLVPGRGLAAPPPPATAPPVLI